MAKGIGPIGFKGFGNADDETTPALGLEPQQLSGSSIILGPVIDRLYFNGALCNVAYGAITGTPDAVSLAWALRHGANSDGSTDWAALADGGRGSDHAWTDTDPAAAAVVNKLFDLEAAERYVRLGVTPTFTGGSSPKQFCSAVIIPAAYRGTQS